MILLYDYYKKNTLLYSELFIEQRNELHIKRLRSQMELNLITISVTYLTDFRLTVQYQIYPLKYRTLTHMKHLIWILASTILNSLLI